MTPQEYKQITSYHERNKQQAIQGISIAKLSYIKTNAPYPVGEIVKVEDKGKISLVRVKAYTIEDDLTLTPIYSTLEGKNIFLSRPVVIK
jgi:hypothetical protein